METEFVDISLSNGEIIKAEVTKLGGERNVGADDEIQSFKIITNTIKGVAGEVKQVLEVIAPDKISIEFGIELALEAGKLTALIAKGSAKASLKITLGWDNT